MITTVTCWAARWSRNARIWLVIDPPRRHRGRGLPAATALDADADLRIPFGDVDARAPRVHHLHDAPHLLPADRGPPGRTDWQGVCSGEGGSKQDSHTRAHRQQSTVPADKLLCPPPPN